MSIARIEDLTELTPGQEVVVDDTITAWAEVLKWDDETLEENGLARIVESLAVPPPGKRQSDETLLLQDGVVVRQPIYEDIPLDQLKPGLYEAVASHRREALASVVVGSLVIPWDDTTENKVSKAIQALERKPEGTTVSWEVTRGVFQAMSLSTLQAIGDAAFEKQQAAFANAEILCAQIRDAADAAEALSIDITTGWPS